MMLAVPILFTLLVGCNAFGVAQNNKPVRARQTHVSASKGPGNIQRPQNEFSRTYRTESVLGNKQRDYQVSIDASDEERAKLAKRFDLSNIGKLEAELVMRREPGVKGTANRVTSVVVEGTVVAGVTQTCVRTNEDFDVDLEFPLFAVVRPITSLLDAGGSGDDDLSELDGFFEGERKSRGKKGRHRDGSVSTSARNVNEMDMVELQRMLQDFDVEDDVMEDEAIYSFDGIIDLGELVSQLFWLKLDPYPKKPGTYPIRTSITG